MFLKTKSCFSFIKSQPSLPLLASPPPGRIRNSASAPTDLCSCLWGHLFTLGQLQEHLLGPSPTPWAREERDWPRHSTLRPHTWKALVNQDGLSVSDRHPAQRRKRMLGGQSLLTFTNLTGSQTVNSLVSSEYLSTAC